MRPVDRINNAQMKGSQKNPVIRISESDNVGIASGEDGLHKGIRLENGVTVIQHIPMGHKVALVDIDKGESIVRYGHAIGFAAKAIRAGEWVNGSNILQPIPSRLKDLPLQNNLMPEPEPLTGYTFMGYRNKDGISASHRDYSNRNSSQHHGPEVYAHLLCNKQRPRSGWNQ